ncbi:peptide ABC transporter substrate-binding protein [Lactobacillus sp. Sy-1]|uniref:peptide ABC transporter substrate-binding protein n=1 Tax=Lactobacillus sp. Sy-1 TaxID=2109645 RepID=UPI001C5B9176|nr:peptide ABC transporter substrate-binding protein [Lactobacillus sp. Sy-1]MBW1606139.1 peptide ABC transporter substrate-binding protein [Lactobacillus sp. Sy-1]
MKKLLAVSTISILAGLTLAACGNQSTNQESKKRQTLNLAAASPLSTIDISKSTGYGSTGNVFESFYRLGKNGATDPALAKSGSSSKDGKTWTFKLRDAKWSDGSPITAADFVYSWRRTVNPKTKAQYAYLFNSVVNGKQINEGKLSPNKLGIKALDKHTVQISLVKPVAYFKTLMAYPLFGPQSKKVVDKYGDKYGTKSQYMVYSGPFKIINWNGTGNTWAYVKNDNYYDSKDVKLKRINYNVIQSPSTSLNLYNQGKLDITSLSTEQLKNYQKSPDLKDYSYSMTTYLRYNFADSNAENKKVINNINIRKAISLSIDRSLLSKKVLGFKSAVTTGFVPHGLANDPKTGQDFADQQSVDNTLNYNQKLAKQLWAKGLKEVGTNKVSLTILASNDDPNSGVVTQYLKGQLESVLKGFTLNIRSVPGQIASQQSQKGEFDISLAAWGGDFKDPITFLQIPQANTPYNYGKYNNTKYDNLIDRAENKDANNPEKRWQDLIGASMELNRDQGISPLFQNETYYLQKASVKNIIHNTAGPQWSYKYTYIK